MATYFHIFLADPIPGTLIQVMVFRLRFVNANPSEVFQAQQFFLQARLDYLKEVSAYNKAQYALKVAKGENL